MRMRGKKEMCPEDLMEKRKEEADDEAHHPDDLIRCTKISKKREEKMKGKS